MLPLDKFSLSSIGADKRGIFTVSEIRLAAGGHKTKIEFSSSLRVSKGPSRMAVEKTHSWSFGMISLKRALVASTSLGMSSPLEEQKMSLCDDARM